MLEETFHDIYILPASLSQQRLWVLAQFEGNEHVYNIPGSFIINGKFSSDDFIRSMQIVTERHEILRTTFDRTEDGVMQIIHPSMPVLINTVDISYNAIIEQESQLEELFRIESNLPFDLATGPLFRIKIVRLGVDKYILFFTIHHIICDAHSLPVLFNEIGHAYDQLHHTNAAALLPPLSIQYADFASWQKEKLQSADSHRHLEYWKNHLKNAPLLFEMPFDYLRPHLQSFDGGEVCVELNTSLSNCIYSFCRHHQITPFMAFYSAWLVLLARYTQQYDLVIGMPVAGRIKKELEPLIGFFVNLLPVRTTLNPGITFTVLLQKVKTIIAGCLQHQDLPFEEILQSLKPERNLSYHPLFQILFNYIKSVSGNFSLGGTSVTPLKFKSITAKFDLTLTVTETPTQFTVGLEYCTKLFNRESIVRMVGHFEVLLEHLITMPDTAICNADLLTRDEVAQLFKWNNTVTPPVQTPVFLYTVLSHAAGQSPEKIAVGDMCQSFTYKQLQHRADAIADCLLSLGVGKTDVIGIAVDRSADMLALILAIMRLGAIYVPLDTQYPEKRLEYICKDAAMKLVITHERYESLFKHSSRCVFFEETIIPYITALFNHKFFKPDIPMPEPDDIAYIIFTSGSTGNPKGVMVRHLALYNFLRSMCAAPGITAGDTLLAITSISFDISLLELLLPVFSGASLVITAQGDSMDAIRLAQLIQERDITIMQATPTTWKLLLQTGWEGKMPFTALVGGEALPIMLATALAQKVTSLWNMYGPTETTIWSLISRIHSSPTRITIGRPIMNTQALVLDPNGRLVPTGVPGELFIGGDGLAAGYLNQPELTNNKFIPNPFNEKGNSRLYKTDDLVKILPSGEIMYIGRNDTQIKLRGFRIELGEIESVIRTHPMIKDCLTDVKEIEAEPKIIAYIIAASDSCPDAEDLFKHIGVQLPIYMYPYTFVQLKDFPLTPNGKLDRKRLPEPTPAYKKMAIETFVAPCGEIEETLCYIWETVLGINPISTNANFFTLGGASLQSIQVVNLASQKGLLVKPAWVFEYQTICALAKKCEQHVIDTGEKVISPNISSAGSINITDFFPLTSPGMHNTPAITPGNMIIESLGVYHPEARISSGDIVDACKYPLRFPLERVTGIKERRVAADDEFAIDLAAKAIEDCLQLSSSEVEDIGLLICCNISRYDGPQQFSFEPSTAARLKEKFAFSVATAFDISNACAGTFTALHIAKCFLLSGKVKRAMVVSGELITHIAKTAQKEITNYLDERIACLTVGDSGIAMVLELTDKTNLGFHDLDLFTLASHSELCIGKATNHPHGGVVMYTDAIRMADAGHIPSSLHTLSMLQKNSWPPEKIQHVIMHQTSRIALTHSKKHINGLFKKEIVTDNNFIDNVSERGNTATTSHFVAVIDHVQKNRIKDNDSILFNISASGLTIGNALYKFDDLPSRILKSKMPGYEKKKNKQLIDIDKSGHPCIGIESAAVCTDLTADETFDDSISSNITLQLLEKAGKSCLSSSGFMPEEIDILIYAGIYRDQFIVEPSMASLAGGRLQLNAESTERGQTLAFDILSAECGFLQACEVAVEMIKSQESKRVMILTSDFDNNRKLFPALSLCLKDIATAVIISKTVLKKGFGEFVTHFFPEYQKDWYSFWTWNDQGSPYIHYTKNPLILAMFPRYIAEVIKQVSDKEGVQPDKYTHIVLPGLQEDLLLDICKHTGIDRNKLLVIREKESLCTSLIPYMLHTAIKSQKVIEGDILLLVAVGSGIQVSAVIYYN